MLTITLVAGGSFTVTVPTGTNVSEFVRVIATTQGGRLERKHVLSDLFNSFYRGELGANAMFELLFATKRNPANAAVAEPDRKSILLEEIKDLDGALENQNATMRAFRVEHMAVINGHSVLLFAKGGDPGLARANIEERWTALCTEREEIQKRRGAVLSELARYL